MRQDGTCFEEGLAQLEALAEKRLLQTPVMWGVRQLFWLTKAGSSDQV